MSATPNLPTLTVALDASTCMLIGETMARHVGRYVPPTDTMSTAPWLDAKGAAEHLGLTVDALYKRARAGLIPVHQDGPGTRMFFDRHELDEHRRTGRW